MLGAGVALGALLAAVLLYSILLGRDAPEPTLVWIDLVEGVMIACVTLITWKVGASRLAAVSGLLASIVVVLLGLFLPQVAVLSVGGTSAFIWAVMLAFLLRATRRPTATDPPIVQAIRGRDEEA